jgi:hypothetical protein
MEGEDNTGTVNMESGNLGDHVVIRKTKADLNQSPIFSKASYAIISIRVLSIAIYFLC